MTFAFLGIVALAIAVTWAGALARSATIGDDERLRGHPEVRIHAAVCGSEPGDFCPLDCRCWCHGRPHPSKGHLT